MKQTLSRILIGLTLMCALVVLGAGQALANVAANTEIINSAQLTFDGGSATATVTVTVQLVPAQPNVSITNASGAYTTPNSPALTDSVVITSTANGPASYTVTPSVVSDANATGTSVTGGATVTIGASVTTGTSATTYVTIPASGATGNGAVVNGIGVNDTIVFTVNGNTYTKIVTDTIYDSATNTYRLTWTGAIPLADVPGAGVQVGEQATVNLSVLPGTVTTAGSNINVSVQAVVSTSGVANVTATNSSPNVWTTPNPNVLMTKYVRNLSNAASNPADTAVGATSFTINGVTRVYHKSGVTGKPGDLLEYVIVASNTGGSALTNSAIADNVPVSFVNFQTGVYNGKEIFYIDTANASHQLIAGAVGANQASFVVGNSPNLIVNVGSGANATTKGSIAGGTGVTIAYQVTIK